MPRFRPSRAPLIAPTPQVWPLIDEALHRCAQGHEPEEVIRALGLSPGGPVAEVIRQCAYGAHHIAATAAPCGAQVHAA